MTAPRFCLSLTGAEINESEFSCSGEQLCLLLTELMTVQRDIKWFACDVSAVNLPLYWKSFSDGTPREVGTADDFLRQIKAVEQFESAVIFATDGDSTQEFSLEHFTEDERFTDIEFANLQIRAFDTTYFELYSTDKALLEEVHNRFGGKLEQQA